jgi:hypothetical protein
MAIKSRMMTGRENVARIREMKKSYKILARKPKRKKPTRKI